MTRTLGPGVRLHLLRTDRFTTTWCRVALHRDLGPEATATSLLAQVLESATARHPTREALAHVLADLYGASLSVGVEKLGARQVLAASLEWPTAHVPGAHRLLGRGLGLLREVLAEPRRADGAADGPLDGELLQVEQANLLRTLRARRDDKARHALRLCLETACAGEAYALSARGRIEDVGAVTGNVLAALHARLLASAPVDIHLVGDLGLAEAKRAVARHLLWSPRASRARRVPPPVSVRRARARPRRVVEEDEVAQGRLVMAYRAPQRPRSPLRPAMLTLAGVLGGGPWGRLFKVVREQEGLCYHAGASWLTPVGLLLLQAGIDPETEPSTRRLMRRLTREVAAGILDERALKGFREAVRHRLRALPDDRGALVARHHAALAYGIDDDPRKELARLEAVGPDAVRRAGRTLGLDTTCFLTARRHGARRRSS